MPNKKDPKQNILDTAASLIARKGFSAVGVREIAKKSKVNISMISYYFGSKAGILKVIIENYFDLVSEILKDIRDESLPSETEIKKIIGKFAKLMREKEDFCRVAMSELPFDLPEVADFKLNLIKRNRKYVGNKIQKRYHIYDKTVHIIISHAFISLVYSNFLFGKSSNKTPGVLEDEKYYDKYSDIISIIFLNGLNGLRNTRYITKEKK